MMKENRKESNRTKLFSVETQKSAVQDEEYKNNLKLFENMLQDSLEFKPTNNSEGKNINSERQEDKNDDGTAEYYEFQLFSGSGPSIIASTTKTQSFDVKYDDSKFEQIESSEFSSNLNKCAIGYDEILKQSTVPWPRCFFPGKVIHVNSEGYVLGEEPKKVSKKRLKKKLRRKAKALAKAKSTAPPKKEPTYFGGNHRRGGVLRFNRHKSRF